jgi:uncharacterized protein (TIGR00369 family)
MEKNVEGDSSSNARTGVIPFALMRQHSGLEVLQLVKEGRLPLPPMSDMISFDLRDFEFGRATIVSTPSERYRNTMGIMHGGYAMTLLDSCMGAAIYTTLSSGIGYTTIETKVNFVKPITTETELLRAVGHAVHAGTRTATAEGRLIDGEGKLYAHGTTTCFLFPLDDAPGPLRRS